MLKKFSGVLSIRVKSSCKAIFTGEQCVTGGEKFLISFFLSDSFCFTFHFKKGTFMKLIFIRRFVSNAIQQWRISLSVLGLMMSLGLSACASGSMGHLGNRYLYGFNFDAITDMRDIEIQNCLYLTTRPNYGIRCRIVDGEALQRHGQSGYMYPPSSLYVKWKDLKTNHIYEANADLKAGIPKGFKFENLFDIAFVCDRDLLEVFLVTKEPRPEGWPIIGPSKLQQGTGIPIYLYEDNKVYTIASIKGKLM